MKFEKIFLLTASLLLIVGCSSKKSSTSSESQVESEEEEEKGPDYEDVEIEMYALLNNKVSSYPLTVPYQKSYFNNPTTKFNKSLALLSFGLCTQSYTRADIGMMYSKLHFNNIYLSGDYFVEPTEDTVAFAIANRDIDDYCLVSMTFRSGNYNAEWANNFDLGLEGNHNGFNKAMEKAKNELYDYIANNCEGKKLKFWINGYSRGAAIANMLADVLMTEKAIKIEENNAYVYTFETPRGLTKANCHNYKNIFNVINSSDIVTYVAPEKFGLYRSGIDIDIYSDKVDTYMQSFDKGILFPPLLAKSGRYTNDYEHTRYLVNTIFREGNDPDKDKYMSTRNDYVNRYQEAIKYFINIMFTADSYTLNTIYEAFNELSMTEKLALRNEENLYMFLKEQFDKTGFSYDDEQLHSTCNGLKNLISYPFSTFLEELYSTTNINRTLYMHAPESVYTLLKNYK